MLRDSLKQISLIILLVLRLTNSRIISVNNCQKPESVSYTQSSNIDRLILGATIVYRCIPEYELTAGNMNRTCKEDGKWSGSPPVCSKSEMYIYIICDFLHRQ